MNKWPPVVDADDDRLVCLLICDFKSGPKRQEAMSDGQPISIEHLTASGLAAMIAIADAIEGSIGAAQLGGLERCCLSGKSVTSYNASNKERFDQ